MLYCKFCNKECKNDNSLRNHERLCSKNPNKQITNLIDIDKDFCQYCNNEFSSNNLKRHENSCYLNPINLKKCVVCDSPIKNFKINKGTCSYSCSNKHFSHLRNKPQNYKNYTTICWNFHKKECVVCGENKIVAVHHLNEDHDDNRPENLIPLCPTHHQYIHSKFKDEVQPFVDKYIEKFIRL